MTTPDLSFIIPSKAKTYVALVGSVLSFVVPFVLQVQDALPAPWPAVIGCVLFILSALGVYHAPYVPPGAVVVPDVKPPPPDLPPATPDNPATPAPWHNPWLD